MYASPSPSYSGFTFAVVITLAHFATSYVCERYHLRQLFNRRGSGLLETFMNRARLSILVAVMALVVCGIFAGRLTAGHGSVPTPPGGIATIDMEKVFNALQETIDKNNDLKNYTEGLKAELVKLRDNANAAFEVAKNLSPGQQREDKFREAAEMDINVQVKDRMFQAMVDRRQTETLRAINEKIADAAKRLAQKNGYSMVMSTDDAVRIPERAGSDDAKRIMSLKRFLYVAPEHDVSQELITMLNAEFAARR